MSVELVTGYQGVDSGGEPKRHVSSSEDGARQAGTVGLGCYVLSTGSKLSASMEDANTLVVADGDVMMYGRHVSMPDPTSFTIPTGVQGQKVSNLAVLRYEVGSSSVESVTPLVLTGEPSTSNPTDPEYNEGSILDGDSPVDFPLYRVVTNGINAGDPEPLFDVLLPMADLWNYVSQHNAIESAVWPDTLPVTGVRVGRTVQILVTGHNVLVPSGILQRIATLAEGSRPEVECDVLIGVSGSAWILLRCTTDGGVYLFSQYGSGDVTIGTLTASATFVAEG